MTIKQTYELLKFIDEYTYPTGSAAYGLPSPSDNDRFCTKPTYDQIAGMAKNYGMLPVQDSGYDGTSRTLLLSVAGQSFHIFHVPDKDILTLNAVTEMVKTAATLFPAAMGKKAFRVLLFRQLRDLLTMMNGESGSGVTCGTIPVERKAE